MIATFLPLNFASSSSSNESYTFSIQRALTVKEPYVPNTLAYTLPNMCTLELMGTNAFSTVPCSLKHSLSCCQLTEYGRFVIYSCLSQIGSLIRERQYLAGASKALLNSEMLKVLSEFLICLASIAANRCVIL